MWYCFAKSGVASIIQARPVLGSMIAMLATILRKLSDSQASLQHNFSRNEFELWQERYSSGTAVPVPLVYEDSVFPIVEAGQALIVEDSHQIDDGMWLEPAPGHTPGHVMLNLKSGNNSALMSGDVIHHPLQLIRPEWSSRACEDPVQSAISRTKMLERIADTDTLLCPAHFGSPTMGHVISHATGGFRYNLIDQ